MATLKNVAEKTGYTYIYVKMVHCGLKDNVKILKSVCEEKKKEIKELNKRIKQIEKMKENRKKGKVRND